jgi:hypothetical protein
MNGLANNGPTPDQIAAHELLSELRTRISTQPLPYQYGVEATALESLWQVFIQARAAMKNHPGCCDFARRVTTMLNRDLRPVTAKWDRAHAEGRLNSRDGANEFRADLENVQKTLRKFTLELQKMAYGENNASIDELTPPVLTSRQLDEWFDDLPFGIAYAEPSTPSNVAQINKDEADAIAKRRAEIARRREEIAKRRTNSGTETAADVNAVGTTMSKNAARAVMDANAIGTMSGVNAIGLGLSGGGIRSATFCLGVVQVLTACGFLEEIDFLSTVSGGGYVGCFLTSRLGNAQSYSDLANPHGPDTAPVRYMRQHAKYLAASDLKEQWTMVTSTFAGMILNWTAPILIIAVAAWAAIGIHEATGQPSRSLDWTKTMAAAGGATLLALILYSMFLRLRLGKIGGWILGVTTAFTFALGLIWLLGKAYNFIANSSDIHSFPWKWGATGLFAAVATAAPAVVRFIPVLKAPSTRRIVLKVALLLAGFIVPLGGVALSFLFFYFGSSRFNAALPPWNPLHYVDGFTVLASVTGLCALIALFLLNINLTSPHRLYRNQLAKTFVQLSETDTTPVPLARINPADTAPYHLINATVNLPSSTDPAVRERRSDFFLFSKFWCGAPSIGYHPTASWKADHAPVDIATAMAISGAAVSSYMGLESISSLTALLTFLNVRLGFWIRRPDTHAFVDAPGFACLLREMTGVAMSEKQAWINLSDGGHIENMGVYELLRRRCKYIISVDGEADPQSTFQGHLTLVRHAMIDFGIRIEPDLNSLRPDITTRFSQTHFMLCRVFYPETADKPAGFGFILYMKLSLTGNEIELIRRYRALHPDFPHQSTLDQFFDEEQFEIYRQLGVHVAEGLFAPALINSNQRPATIPEWFKTLAANLLEPASGEQISRREA